LPKEEIWTEYLINLFPIDKNNFKHQMLARLLLLMTVWLIGLLMYSVDGLVKLYVFNLQLVSLLFGTGFIVLYGSYMIQRSLPDVILSFQPILQLEETRFQELFSRIKNYSYSFLPCLTLDFILVFFLAGIPEYIQGLLIEGMTLHSFWDICFLFFIDLIGGTGIWMGISIWITILLISRQPLRVELSENIVEKFRGLAMLAWWFSLFYFMAISLGMGINLLGAPVVSVVEIILSPFLLFIVIGLVSVLFPFYNVHRTLFRLKRGEIEGIEEEYIRLQKELEEALAEEPDTRRGEKTLAVMGHIISLQIRERNVRGASEWPIDISFISRLLSLVLLPAIVRISIELFNRFYLA